MGIGMEFTKFDELSERIRAGSYKNSGFLLELVDCVQEYTKEQMGLIRQRVCQEFYKPERSLGTVRPDGGIGTGRILSDGQGFNFHGKHGD